MRLPTLSPAGGGGLGWGDTAVTELPSFSVADEVALVTGASSGIGLHLAEVLAAAGAKVALAARRTDRLEQACAAIRERGGSCLAVALDVTDRDSIVAALSSVEAGLGPLSVLVNNAGVVVSKPFFEHTEEDWDHVVDTNLKGAWIMAREFAHHLVERKHGGCIINIASVLSTRTIARVPSYLAAKAGLLHLNGAMAMELARYNIRVNAIAPGYVITDFNRDFLMSEAGLKLAARVPMKRVGQVEDLGGALLFLASPASAYMTGACLAVDGGHGIAAI